MLDVLHFFFEEDSRFASAEEAEAVSAGRTTLYRDLYNVEYKYKLKARPGKSSSSNEFSYSDPDEVKPYIPPTEFDPDSFNPFGEVLDAPIG